MNENANPLDYILKCTEQGSVPKLFTIQNAKDELKRLRQELDRLNRIFDNPVMWARINDKGDIYSPRFRNNPALDQNTVVPLYSTMSTLKPLYEKSNLLQSKSKQS